MATISVLNKWTEGHIGWDGMSCGPIKCLRARIAMTGSAGAVTAASLGLEQIVDVGACIDEDEVLVPVALVDTDGEGLTINTITATTDDETHVTTVAYTPVAEGVNTYLTVKGY